MINKLYEAKSGTPHVVRVVGRYREMLRGERMENTAHTYQVLAHRMMPAPEHMYGCWFRDENFDSFCMEEELFHDNYREIEG